MSGRRRLPRAEREQQTLDVARRLFAERGYGAVTMDEVAAEVGVTKPLLYSYFGNKDGLAVSLVQPAADALARSVLEAVEQARSPVEAVRAGVDAFFGFLDGDREAWRVLFDPTLPAAGPLAETRGRLTATIAEVQLRGLPEAARPQVEALSAALLAAAEAMGRWWLAHDGGMAAADAADLLTSTIAPGLQQLAGSPDHVTDRS